MLGSLARFSYRCHRLVLFLIFLSFIAALLSSFSSVFFAFKTRFIPPSLLTPRIPGPRSIPGRRSCLAGPPGPEIGPISVPLSHPNAHLKGHQEGEGRGSSPLSITSTGKQGGEEGRRKEESGERSRLLGHPGWQFPQDFALPSP